MRISDRAKAMITDHEGVRFRPYRCPAKLFTIGVGHVMYPDQAKLKIDDRMAYELKPEDNRFWSGEEVDSLLVKDLVRFERGVARLCPGSVSNQNHFDALVSFSFNVGLGSLQKSTLRMKYNRAEYEAAGEEFLKWAKVGGKVINGLLKRRQNERAVFLGAK
jgi:lysozyme